MIFDVEFFAQGQKRPVIIIDGNCPVNNCVSVDAEKQSISYYPADENGHIKSRGAILIVDTLFPRNCSILLDGAYIGGWHERD